MDKVKIIVSNFILKEKPKDFDIRAQSPKHYSVGLADIPRIAELISEGRCWRNGNYDLTHKSFKKKYVVDSHFVVLDFDSVKETPQEMCEIMEPNFWYYTLSQGVKPHNNFRMVWVLTEAIGPQEFAFVYQWFLDKFPQADRNVKDISRLWYGGNGVYEVLNNGLIDVSHILSDFVVSSGDIRVSDLEVSGPQEKIKVGSFWESDLTMNCPLWTDYKAGRASRSQRLILAGNLKFLECDELPVLDEVLKYSEKPWEWKRWFEDDNVRAVPILNGETLIEYFGSKLF